MTEGIKICVAWAQHFYNIGLRDDLNLDHVGLAVRVNPELVVNWQDYQALENASKTDLNGLRDDFMGLGDMDTPN